MTRISTNQLNVFRRALSSLKSLSVDRYRHWRAMHLLKQQDFILHHSTIEKYNDTVSYAYRFFDCSKEDSIYKFMPYSDKQYGGDSTVELLFDKANKCLTIQGFIQTKDRNKMIQYPSIGLSRLHPYPLFCGPLNALSLQIQHDGRPMHVGVELRSPIEGIVSCYGIITSKVKGWNTYEIPLQNMMVVGAQDGPRRRNDYKMPNNSSTVFDRQAYDAHRILTTEAFQPIIHDLNIRLLDTQPIRRKVSIRSISLVRRAGSEQFLKEYQQPYFFMVNTQPYLFDESDGVAWLEKDYNSMRAIDLGDKIYHRK